ncbi:N-acetyltransferase, partial [Xanthomonas citri pv. citri]|nr:N-acetyltransferase [Xanthomonas citri pv. citri]
AEGLRRACVMDSCGPRDSQYHGLLRSEWRGQQADD